MFLVSPVETCIKRGVILTCYVDGRKRYRAVRLLTSMQRRNAMTPADLQDPFTPRK